MSEAPAATKSAAQASAESFRAAVEKIRARSDLAAKTLGTLGTTAVTTFGIAKADDVFPVPGGGVLEEAIAALAIASAIAMGLVVLFFARGLWHVSDAIYTTSDVETMDVTGKEKDTVISLYERMAKLNGVTSLSAYEARGRRFRRIADATDDAVRKKALDQKATQIAEEIGAVQARAAMLVVRMRSARAVRGRAAQCLYVVFILALVTSGASGNYLEAKRNTDKRTLAQLQDCGKTAEAIAKAKLPADRLPRSCGTVTRDPSPPLAP